MILSQRISGNLTDEFIDNLIKDIKKKPHSCNDVWLSSYFGYPKLLTHEEHLKCLQKAAKKIRKIDVGVSFQLHISIGHGDGTKSCDCSGLIYDGSGARRLVGHDGVTSEYCFCWRGEEFKKYIIEEVKIYAKLKPDVFWIDDDFRMTNHSPVKYGCFCDDCIKTFNEENNTNYTRESLVDEFMYGDVDIREKYIKFQQRGLYDFLFEMFTAIHEVSPNSVPGLQNCANGSFTGYGFDYFMSAMKNATGHNPHYRPGGGAYFEHNMTDMLYKAQKLNWQNQMLPDYVTHIYPEIENYPRYFSCKSPAATGFEASYYLANGNTDMSFFMLAGGEPFERYEKASQIFERNYSYWERLSDINFKTHQSGAKYFLSKEMHKRKNDKSVSIDEFNKEPFAECLNWLRIGIPLAYSKDKYDDNTYILHPESSKVMTDEDVKFLMTKNVLTDGETIQILNKRGFAFPFESNNIPDEIFSFLRETMIDHKVSPKNNLNWKSLQYDERCTRYYFNNISSECEVFSIYAPTINGFEQNFDEKYPYGVSGLIFNTENGGKWAVSGYDLWHGKISFNKRNQLLNILDYISDNNVPARILSPIMAVLNPRVDNNNKTACVSVANYTIGEEEDIKILIRNPKTEEFVFMSETSPEIKLDYEKTNNGYILNIPKLNGYSVGTIFCD